MSLVVKTPHEKNQLLHGIINQLESDFDDNEYDSMDELLTKLMENESNHTILIDYLSDTAKENWLEGKTNERF